MNWIWSTSFLKRRVYVEEWIWLIFLSLLSHCILWINSGSYQSSSRLFAVELCAFFVFSFSLFLSDGQTLTKKCFFMRLNSNYDCYNIAFIHLHLYIIHNHWKVKIILLNLLSYHLCKSTLLVVDTLQIFKNAYFLFTFKYRNQKLLMKNNIF